jgi:hypothetical protein
MASTIGSVATLVTAAAAGSNGRFAGSSAAELEEWLVSTFGLDCTAAAAQQKQCVSVLTVIASQSQQLSVPAAVVNPHTFSRVGVAAEPLQHPGLLQLTRYVSTLTQDPTCPPTATL